MTTRSWLLSRREFTRFGVGLFSAPALLAACGSVTEPSSPRLTARPGVPTVPPVAGRTVLGLETGRDGLLYVPSSYDPDVPAPLFVALHGATGSAANWASYEARAEARGMILLAPDSREVTWDVVLGYLGPDIAFLNRALEHTFDRCRIDPTRLCLGGFSDGASYALSIGRSNGDLFSHLVGYSPGFLTEFQGTLVGLPRVFISHGTSDPVLPIDQTREVIVPYLQGRGHAVEYREFDGGHLVPAEISEAALDWVLPVA